MGIVDNSKFFIMLMLVVGFIVIMEKYFEVVFVGISGNFIDFLNININISRVIVIVGDVIEFIDFYIMYEVVLGICCGGNWINLIND